MLLRPKGAKITTDEELIGYFLDEAKVAAVHGGAFAGAQERLRVLAGLAEELCAVFEQTPAERQGAELARIGQRFGQALPCDGEELALAVKRSLDEVVSYTAAIRLNLQHSVLGRQIDADNPLYAPGGKPDLIVREGGRVVEPLDATTMPQSAQAKPPGLITEPGSLDVSPNVDLELDVDLDGRASSDSTLSALEAVLNYLKFTTTQGAAMQAAWDHYRNEATL